MVIEAVRGYVLIVSGLGEVTRQRAVTTARQLLDQGGGLLGAAVTGAGSADVARQVQGLADDLIATSRTNRDLLVGLIRTEIERTVARLGLVGADELASMARVVERLQTQLDAAIAFGARGRGSQRADHDSVRREPETFGRAAEGGMGGNGAGKRATRKAPTKVAAKHAASKQASARTASRPPSGAGVAAAAGASVKKTAAKKTAVKQTAAKKTAVKQTAKKTTAKKTTAKKSQPSQNTATRPAESSAVPSPPGIAQAPAPSVEVPEPAASPRTSGLIPPSSGPSLPGGNPSSRAETTRPARFEVPLRDSVVDVTAAEDSVTGVSPAVVVEPPTSATGMRDSDRTPAP